MAVLPLATIETALDSFKRKLKKEVIKDAQSNVLYIYIPINHRQAKYNIQEEQQIATVSIKKIPSDTRTPENPFFLSQGSAFQKYDPKTFNNTIQQASSRVQSPISLNDQSYCFCDVFKNTTPNVFLFPYVFI